MTYAEINKWRITSLCKFSTNGIIQLPYSDGVSIEYAYAPGKFLVVAFVYPKEDDDYNVQIMGKRYAEYCENGNDKVIFDALVKMAGMLVHLPDEKESDE